MPRVPETTVTEQVRTALLKLYQIPFSLHNAALQRTNASSQPPQVTSGSGLPECYQEFVKLSACIIFFQELENQPHVIQFEFFSCESQSTPDTQSAVCVENVSGEKRIAPTCEHLLEKSISPLTIQLSEKNICACYCRCNHKTQMQQWNKLEGGRGQETGETHSFSVRRGQVCVWASLLNTLAFTFQTRHHLQEIARL